MWRERNRGTWGAERLELSGRSSSILGSEILTQRNQRRVNHPVNIPAILGMRPLTLTHGFFADRLYARDVLHEIVRQVMPVLQEVWAVIGKPDFLICILPG